MGKSKKDEQTRHLWSQNKTIKLEKNVIQSVYHFDDRYLLVSNNDDEISLDFWTPQSVHSWLADMIYVMDKTGN